METRIQEISVTEIKQVAEELTDAGWHFSPDASTWTGGFWWHEDMGFVTNQGGHFQTYTEATAAVVRMLESIETINS